MGYAVMSNHVHLVVHFDPNGADALSDEEVAFRWCCIFDGQGLNKNVRADEERPQSPEDFTIEQAIRYHDLLLDQERVERCRQAIASLSRFMQHLKQPFALWANRQDECKGHFFESRFYSGALLDETDLMSCMAYVDLNPVEADIASSLREAENTSIHERLYAERFDASRLEAYLAPLWSEETAGDEATPTRKLSHQLITYAKQLNLAILYLSGRETELPKQLESWMVRLLNRERHKRSAAAFFDYAT
ncbi:MAG: hypothetical protein AAF529_10575 [Pseudomonadota bacterium]